jgi:sugar phosphate isomerase/epimerase
METTPGLSRRSFLAMAGSASLATALAAKNSPPVGIELYSVREQLLQDLFGTVRAVAKMGYQGVEFYSPYMEWKPGYAKEVRRLLDDHGIRCYSTHNSHTSFMPENLPQAIELNQIIGSQFIVMASAGPVSGLDGWKGVAERLNAAAAAMKSAGLRAGFHNHQLEFTPISGVRPMEVLAKNTDRGIALQLDVGTCVEMGVDPVAWIRSNPGRISSVHCKDWAPGEAHGYRVLFGEGAAPWKELFKAAEDVGGVEYYLIEQEGSAYSPIETAQRCLFNYRKLRSE